MPGSVASCSNTDSSSEPPALLHSSPESLVVSWVRASKHISLAPELLTPLPSPIAQYPSHGDRDNQLSPLHHGFALEKEADEAWKTLDDIGGLQFVIDHDRDVIDRPVLIHPISSEEGHVPPVQHDLLEQRKPLQKWMNTLRKRGMQRQKAAETDVPQPSPFLHIDTELARSYDHGHRRCSSSESSIAFVTTMRSPSVSLASFSVIGRSRLTPGVPSNKAHSRTGRSSRASASGVRSSEDSQHLARSPLMDPMVVERSLQRRRILEELISTEEGYIRDVRFLMNVYVTILASLPTQAPGLRSSINQNMTEIVELHEELLQELQRIAPESENPLQDAPVAVAPKSGKRGHHRWHSLDSVPKNHNDRFPWLQAGSAAGLDPRAAADVAKVFISKMHRFFIYEEYGAKYELMIKDIGNARRTMADWEKYQRGLEALAASLGPRKCHGKGSKKSLTISDLLVKPIQRVCKYPLLFAELLKYTPVVDCPQSHMAIEDALLRLREATVEINRATDDPIVKLTLERTWNLQDRLVFADQTIDAVSKNRIRSFGHIYLCGALHICWQAKESVAGQYLICLLYRDWLCIASPGKLGQTYHILLCISLGNVRIEDADNGRGLQCHTAPYSWKVVFECGCELYELLMTACSLREYQEWRGRLQQSSSGSATEPSGLSSFRAPSFQIKSLGTVFGKPGTVAQRISIHRATTVGPKTTLCQVILKNTTVDREGSAAALAAASANPRPQRSQSLLAPPLSRVTVLSPSRNERSKLEGMLSDVWTREVLPFPGITVRARSEHLVRSGASSMMRKLSVASIASSFTKRSASIASTTARAYIIAAAARDDGKLGALGHTMTRTESDGAPPLLKVQRRTASSNGLTCDTKSLGAIATDSASDLGSGENLGLAAVLSYSDTAIDKYGSLAGSNDSCESIMARSRRFGQKAPVGLVSKIRACQESLKSERTDGSNSPAASRQNSVKSSKSAKEATAEPMAVTKEAETEVVIQRISIVNERPKTPSRTTTGDTDCGAETPSSIRSARRWAKAGIHRGVSFQGIRSLFR